MIIFVHYVATYYVCRQELPFRVVVDGMQFFHGHTGHWLISQWQTQGNK